MVWTVGAFVALDWAVLIGYLVVVMGIGWAASRAAGGSAEAFFLGGRNMPVWAVTLSVMATALSAATFIGGPAQAFSGDLTYLIANLGGILAVLLVAWLFVPAFYASGALTVYGYLGRRFGPGAARTSAIAFRAGRLLADGAPLFMAGIAFSFLLSADPDMRLVTTLVAIVALGVIGAAYTALGGIRAVIWTDVVQIVMVVGVAIVCLFLLLDAIPLSVPEIVAELRNAEGGDKLKVFSLSTDPAAPYTLWTALALTLLNMGAYGTDHDLAQRVMTCRSAVRGSAALIGAILVNIPIVILFMTLGLLLFIFYGRPDLMGDLAPADALAKPGDVYPQYLVHHLPPGVTGLAMAGLFAAALSSFDSAVNAMAATWHADVIGQRCSAIGARRVHTSRRAVVVFALLLTVMAVVAAILHLDSEQTLLDFALGVMTFAYAGLLGVFLTARLTRRGNLRSVIAALLTGAAAVTLCYTLPHWSTLLFGERWKLAFAWWMVIGTTASLIVCMLGKPANPTAETAPRE